MMMAGSEDMPLEVWCCDRFFSLATIGDHIETAHPDGGEECSECNNKFRDSSSLKKHMVFAHAQAANAKKVISQQIIKPNLIRSDPRSSQSKLTDLKPIPMSSNYNKLKSLIPQKITTDLQQKQNSHPKPIVPILKPAVKILKPSHNNTKSIQKVSAITPGFSRDRVPLNNAIDYLKKTCDVPKALDNLLQNGHMKISLSSSKDKDPVINFNFKKDDVIEIHDSTVNKFPTFTNNQYIQSLGPIKDKEVKSNSMNNRNTLTKSINFLKTNSASFIAKKKNRTQPKLCERVKSDAELQTKSFPNKVEQKDPFLNRPANVYRKLDNHAQKDKVLNTKSNQLKISDPVLVPLPSPPNQRKLEEKSSVNRVNPNNKKEENKMVADLKLKSSLSDSLSELQKQLKHNLKENERLKKELKLKDKISKQVNQKEEPQRNLKKTISITKSIDLVEFVPSPPLVNNKVVKSKHKKESKLPVISLKELQSNNPKKSTKEKKDVSVHNKERNGESFEDDLINKMLGDKLCGSDNELPVIDLSNFFDSGIGEELNSYEETQYLINDTDKGQANDIQMDDYDENDYTVYDDVEAEINKLENNELKAIQSFGEKDDSFQIVVPLNDIEECPDCQEKFADIESLANHFTKIHDSDSIDDDVQSTEPEIIEMSPFVKETEDTNYFEVSPVDEHCESDDDYSQGEAKGSDLPLNNEVCKDISKEDPLDSSILSHKLPLVKRARTLTDGNCWYDALADQIVLHNISGKPSNHKKLRKAVCDTLLKLPQAKVWIPNIFGNKKNYKKFISSHRRPGTWTDAQGIMCQATALYLERNIHIVGTANKDQKKGFTKLEGGGKAELFPPLYVGYYQDKHYQSLEMLPQTVSISSQNEKNGCGETGVQPITITSAAYDTELHTFEDDESILKNREPINDNKHSFASFSELFSVSSDSLLGKGFSSLKSKAKSVMTPIKLKIGNVDMRTMKQEEIMLSDSEDETEDKDLTAKDIGMPCSANVKCFIKESKLREKDSMDFLEGKKATDDEDTKLEESEPLNHLHNLKYNLKYSNVNFREMRTSREIDSDDEYDAMYHVLNDDTDTILLSDTEQKDVEILDIQTGNSEKPPPCPVITNSKLIFANPIEVSTKDVDPANITFSFSNPTVANQFGEFSESVLSLDKDSHIIHEDEETDGFSIYESVEDCFATSHKEDHHDLAAVDSYEQVILFGDFSEVQSIGEYFVIEDCEIDASNLVWEVSNNVFSNEEPTENIMESDNFVKEILESVLLDAENFIEKRSMANDIIMEVMAQVLLVGKPPLKILFSLENFEKGLVEEKEVHTSLNEGEFAEKSNSADNLLDIFSLQPVPGESQVPEDSPQPIPVESQVPDDSPLPVQLKSQVPEDSQPTVKSPVPVTSSLSVLVESPGVKVSFPKQNLAVFELPLFTTVKPQLNEENSMLFTSLAQNQNISRSKKHFYMFPNVVKNPFSKNIPDLGWRNITIDSDDDEDELSLIYNQDMVDNEEVQQMTLTEEITSTVKDAEKIDNEFIKSKEEEPSLSIGFEIKEPILSIDVVAESEAILSIEFVTEEEPILSIDFKTENKEINKSNEVNVKDFEENVNEVEENSKEVEENIEEVEDNVKESEENDVNNIDGTMESRNKSFIAEEIQHSLDIEEKEKSLSASEIQAKKARSLKILERFNLPKDLTVVLHSSSAAKGDSPEISTIVSKDLYSECFEVITIDEEDDEYSRSKDMHLLTIKYQGKIGPIIEKGEKSLLTLNENESVEIDDPHPFNVLKSPTPKNLRKRMFQTTNINEKKHKIDELEMTKYDQLKKRCYIKLDKIKFEKNVMSEIEEESFHTEFDGEHVHIGFDGENVHTEMDDENVNKESGNEQELQKENQLKQCYVLVEKKIVENAAETVNDALFRWVEDTVGEENVNNVERSSVEYSINEIINANIFEHIEKNPKANVQNVKQCFVKLKKLQFTDVEGIENILDVDDDLVKNNHHVDYAEEKLLEEDKIVDESDFSESVDEHFISEKSKAENDLPINNDNFLLESQESKSFSLEEMKNSHVRALFQDESDEDLTDDEDMIDADGINDAIEAVETVDIIINEIIVTALKLSVDSLMEDILYASDEESSSGGSTGYFYDLNHVDGADGFLWDCVTNVEEASLNIEVNAYSYTSASYKEHMIIPGSLDSANVNINSSTLIIQENEAEVSNSFHQLERMEVISPGRRDCSKDIWTDAPPEETNVPKVSIIENEVHLITDIPEEIQKTNAKILTEIANVFDPPQTKPKDKNKGKSQQKKILRKKNQKVKKPVKRISNHWMRFPAIMDKVTAVINSTKPVHDEVGIISTKPVHDEVGIISTKPVKDEVRIISTKPAQNEVGIISTKHVTPKQEATEINSKMPVQDNVETISAKSSEVDVEITSTEKVKDYVEMISSKPHQDEVGTISAHIDIGITSTKLSQETVQPNSAKVKDDIGINTTKPMEIICAKPELNAVEIISTKPVQDEDKIINNPSQVDVETISSEPAQDYAEIILAKEKINMTQIENCKENCETPNIFADTMKHDTSADTFADCISLFDGSDDTIAIEQSLNEIASTDVSNSKDTIIIEEIDQSIEPFNGFRDYDSVTRVEMHTLDRNYSKFTNEPNFCGFTMLEIDESVKRKQHIETVLHQEEEKDSSSCAEQAKKEETKGIEVNNQIEAQSASLLKKVSEEMLDSEDINESFDDFDEEVIDLTDDVLAFLEATKNANREVTSILKKNLDPPITESSIEEDEIHSVNDDVSEATDAVVDYLKEEETTNYGFETGVKLEVAEPQTATADNMLRFKDVECLEIEQVYRCSECFESYKTAFEFEAHKEDHRLCQEVAAPDLEKETKMSKLAKEFASRKVKITITKPVRDVDFEEHVAPFIRASTNYNVPKKTYEIPEPRKARFKMASFTPQPRTIISRNPSKSYQDSDNLGWDDIEITHEPAVEVRKEIRTNQVKRKHMGQQQIWNEGLKKMKFECPCKESFGSLKEKTDHIVASHTTHAQHRRSPVVINL